MDKVMTVTEWIAHLLERIITLEERIKELEEQRGEAKGI